MELWTERQAAAYVAVPGVGRDAARSALKAGVAGRPVQVRGALLYEAEAVRAVRELMDPPCEIVLRTGRPIFVARVSSRTPDPEASWRSWRGADVLAPRSEQVDAVRGWWHLGERTENLLGGVGKYKGVPFVGTCGGLVVLGAEILGIDQQLLAEGAPISELRHSASRGRHRYSRRACAFVLGDPGTWFDDQLGRRFSTGPGGPFRLVRGRNRDRAT